MLSLMPRAGRCAEICVWNGEFSRAILETTAPEQLVLIDPWEMLAERGEGPAVHRKWDDADFMGDMYFRVAGAFADLPHVILCKGYSVPVLSSFPDDYFDWVYIDGNHRYEHVSADLRIAAAKVRPGGIIAGDDFFWKQDGQQHVRDAVLEFTETAGLGRKVTFLPETVSDISSLTKPARMGQQYIIPVTGDMNDVQ